MAWQPRMVVASKTGKSCRPASAIRAVHESASGDEDAPAQVFSRLPRFSQIPPATLFAAIRRSATRSQRPRNVASGTGLAMGWLAARAT